MQTRPFAWRARDPNQCRPMFRDERQGRCKQMTTVATRLSPEVDRALGERALELGGTRAELLRRYVDAGLLMDVVGEVERATRRDVDSLVSRHAVGGAL